MGKKIAIIGAGITGIYSSIILYEKGHNVSVYETNDTAGGILGDIVFEGENYFKTCQLLNANSKWFKKLNEIWILMYLNQNTQVLSMMVKLNFPQVVSQYLFLTNLKFLKK